ncbi:MAG: deoxyribose-phosphate aldolase [Acidimicrobiaceae bacterium]|nr:deoxyribose-phosphate aldolase [Acidimicrobiaceae bacterium]
MDAARARLAISLVDLTNLNDRCTADDVDALCARAAEHGTAAVCVWPDFVEQAVAALASTAVDVATVVNFPTGDERPYAVRTLTERVVGAGADDVDLVLPYRAFVAGDVGWCADVLDATKASTADRAHLKVILETGEIGDVAMIESAARFAIDHGADFVKTSTGKSPVSATPQAAAAMLRAIADVAADRTVGLKPSGGISSAEAAEVYLDQAESAMGSGYLTPATFRFGASSLLDALLPLT